MGTSNDGESEKNSDPGAAHICEWTAQQHRWVIYNPKSMFFV